MSSLQIRLRAGIDSSRNSNTSSFETSFSNGLDLSELMPPSGAPTRSASSELIKIKAQAAMRSKWEEKEEAALEKRIADVHSTKVHEKSVPSEEVVLRAANPLSSKCAGSERNDNFLQFENGCSTKDNGFLSSLVQNHNSERKEYAISQRTLSSKSKIASRAPSNNHKAMNSGRKVLAKKARKSKF